MLKNSVYEGFTIINTFIVKKYVGLSSNSD